MTAIEKIEAHHVEPATAQHRARGQHASIVHVSPCAVRANEHCSSRGGGRRLPDCRDLLPAHRYPPTLRGRHGHLPD